MSSEDPLFILYVSTRTLSFEAQRARVSRSRANHPPHLFLADLRKHWKAQGSRPHHWRLPARSCLDGQVRLRRSPWRQVRVHGRRRMGESTASFPSSPLFSRTFNSFALIFTFLRSLVTPTSSTDLFSSESSLLEPHREEQRLMSSTRFAFLLLSSAESPPPSSSPLPSTLPLRDTGTPLTSTRSLICSYFPLSSSFLLLLDCFLPSFLR